MSAVRRWYVYLVSAISLQAVAWATIALLRNTLIWERANSSSVAFQIAVIVVGLPLFLAHWLGAGRRAARDESETGSLVRRLYLYGMSAGFIAPLAANAFSLLVTLLRGVIGLGAPENTPLGRTASLLELSIYYAVAILILGALWEYHRRVLGQDAAIAPISGLRATLRRLYLLGLAAAGLFMSNLALIQLLRWLFFRFGAGPAIGDLGAAVPLREMARLLIGLPLWLWPWLTAQSLFFGDVAGEQDSALRKLYLYLAVFLSALTTVSSATLILTGLIRRFLSLPAAGDIRDPLAIIIGAGLTWVYHALVLRADGSAAAEQPRQAGIRRLYLYLIAGVGLAAFLIGLSGLVSVLIQGLATPTGLGTGLKEALARFLAALVAGLPVWLLPWRAAQSAATAPGAGVGAPERRSLVRKIYLYFYLFVATMTILGSAVFVVARLVDALITGQTDPLFGAQLGQALAYSLIAAGVLAYHGLTLREDSRLHRVDETEHWSTWRIAVLDDGDGQLGQALVAALNRSLPGVQLLPLALSVTAAQTMGPEAEPAGDAAAGSRLADVSLIVGPWTIAAPEAAGRTDGALATAVARSPVPKILLPTPASGWTWAMPVHPDRERLIQDAVAAVRQAAAVDDRPGLSIGSTIAVVVGLLVLVGMLAVPLILFFTGSM